MRSKRQIQLHAQHIGLKALKRGDVFVLSERYGDKRRIGEYRTLAGLNSGVRRYHSRTLAELDAELRPPRGRRVAEDAAFPLPPPVAPIENAGSRQRVRKT
jgi:hypothetical protein